MSTIASHSPLNISLETVIGLVLKDHQ